MDAKLVSVNVSEEKGRGKEPVSTPWRVIEGYGLKDDAHSGSTRQVSLLAKESIEEMERVHGVKIKPGDFAENFTTSGVDLLSLPPGTKLKIGEEVILEVSEIGKKCHKRCAIYYSIGDCLMPREGVFAVVIKGGVVQAGDKIQILSG